ncbi:MAG: hypothetical protein WC364_14720 [Eubacteriales bacterium]
MTKIFRHPATILTDLSQKYARGEIKHTEYMRSLAFILRRVIKRKYYECGGALYTDCGNINTPWLTHPLVTVEALYTAPGGVCPACGIKDWWVLKGANVLTVSCTGCGSFYKVKGVDARAKGVTCR